MAEFRWHEAATLNAGVVAVPRPPSGNHQFQAITAHPTSLALQGLANALVSGGRFCIAEDAMPADILAGPGDFLTLTGGTSGAPKIIRRTQASWIASFEVNAQQFGLTPRDSLAVLGGLTHSLALYGVLEGLHLGLDTHVLEGLSPVAQARRMAAQSVSVLYATPTQLRLLCRAGVQLPGLRLILSGGGALDNKTAAYVARLCPNAALHQFYGAAETSFITMSDKGQSAGLPYPGVTLRILDAAGQPVNGIGEVWVNSPYLFKEYASGDSEQTRWRDGFLSVGELGKLTPGGALQIVGRMSRMVNVADQKVSPEVLEDFIAALPNIQICAVVAVADALRGQRLIAVLETREDPALTAAVHQSCRGALDGHMVPLRVMTRNRLPLLVSGKVDYAALTKWVEAQI